jgi:hypothetical protein
MSRSPLPTILKVKAVPQPASRNEAIQPTESNQVIGLGVAACVGLRVLLSQEVSATKFSHTETKRLSVLLRLLLQGKNNLQNTALGRASRGKAGYITKVHQVQAAVMVHWESSDVDEEAGWSSCNRISSSSFGSILIQ